MDMLQMDINQCPDDYYAPNAFKNTHKCDQKTSYVNTELFYQIYQKFSLFCFQCVPILGRGFDSGGYKCECLQGFEYPFEDLITYYDGQLVEAEFQNIVIDKESRYDMFKCRLAGATSIKAGTTIIGLFLILGWILVYRYYQTKCTKFFLLIISKINLYFCKYVHKILYF